MMNPISNHKHTVQSVAGISFGVVTAVAVAILVMHSHPTVGAWVTHEGLVPMSALGSVAVVSLLVFAVASCVKPRKPENKSPPEPVTEEAAEASRERKADSEKDEGEEEAPPREDTPSPSPTVSRTPSPAPSVVVDVEEGAEETRVPTPPAPRAPSPLPVHVDDLATVTPAAESTLEPQEMLQRLVDAFEGMIAAGLRRWGKDKGADPASQLAALKASMAALMPMISQLLDRPELLVQGLKPTQLLRRWITAVNCDDPTQGRYEQLAAKRPIDKIEIDHPRLLKQIISILGRKLYLFHKLMQPTKDTTELFREFYMEFLESESIDVMGVGDTQKALWKRQIELREKNIEVAFVKTTDRKHPIVQFALEVYQEKRGKNADLESLQKHLPRDYHDEYMVIPCTVSEHPMQKLKTWGGTIQTVAWGVSWFVDIAKQAKPMLADLVPQGFVDVGIAQKEDPALKAMGGNLAESLTDIIVDGYLLRGKFNETFQAVVRDDFPTLHKKTQALVEEDTSADKLLSGFQGIIDELVRNLEKK